MYNTYIWLLQRTNYTNVRRSKSQQRTGIPIKKMVELLISEMHPIFIRATITICINYSQGSIFQWSPVHSLPRSESFVYTPESFQLQVLSRSPFNWQRLSISRPLSWHSPLNRDCWPLRRETVGLDN